MGIQEPKSTSKKDNVLDFTTGQTMSHNKESSFPINYKFSSKASSTSSNNLLFDYMKEIILNSSETLEDSTNLGYNISNKEDDYTTRKSKEGEDMSNTNWQEKYFDNLDQNMKEIKQGFTETENRISEMVNKHIDYSTHLDKQRHKENLELNVKIDKSINDITSELKTTNRWIIALAVSTIISVGALVITAISAIK